MTSTARAPERLAGHSPRQMRSDSRAPPSRATRSSQSITSTPRECPAMPGITDTVAQSPTDPTVTALAMATRSLMLA